MYICYPQGLPLKLPANVSICKFWIPLLHKLF